MKFTQKNSFCIQGRCSARTCRYCYPWLRKYWDTFGSADKHPLSWASQVSPLCQPNLSPGASWTLHSPATKGLKSRSAGPPDFAPDWQPESNVIHHLLISYLLRPYIFFESFSLPPPLHSWPSEQRGLFSQSVSLPLLLWTHSNQVTHPIFPASQLLLRSSMDLHFAKSKDRFSKKTNPKPQRSVLHLHLIWLISSIWQS